MELSQTKQVTKNRRNALEGSQGTVKKSINFEMRQTQDEYKNESDQGDE